MRNYLLICLVSFQCFASDIYSFKVKDLSLEKFKNKDLLIVNIATRCGYTGQLDDLEKLYQAHKDSLVVIGIPSNEFAGQTPEGDSEVKKFCRRKYNVTFPITSKVLVKGKDKIKLYDYLISATDKEEIKWNFTKFLIKSSGKVIKRFEPSIDPLSKEITSLLK